MRRAVRQVVLAWWLISLAGAQSASGDVFFGGGVAVMDVDASGAEDATNVRLAVSGDLDVLHVDLGLAAELSRTLISGEDRAGEDVEVDTNALYLTIKSPGTIFFRLRAGFMDETVRAGDGSDDDRGFSWGAGLGANVGKVRVELGYTTGRGVIDYLSLGVQFLVAGAGR